MAKYRITGLPKYQKRGETSFTVNPLDTNSLYNQNYNVGLQHSWGTPRTGYTSAGANIGYGLNEQGLMTEGNIRYTGPRLGRSFSGYAEGHAGYEGKGKGLYTGIGAGLSVPFGTGQYGKKLRPGQLRGNWSPFNAYAGASNLESITNSEKYQEDHRTSAGWNWRYGTDVEAEWMPRKLFGSRNKHNISFYGKAGLHGDVVKKEPLYNVSLGTKIPLDFKGASRNFKDWVERRKEKNNSRPKIASLPSYQTRGQVAYSHGSKQPEPDYLNYNYNPDGTRDMTWSMLPLDEKIKKSAEQNGTVNNPQYTALVRLKESQRLDEIAKKEHAQNQAKWAKNENLKRKLETKINRGLDATPPQIAESTSVRNIPEPKIGQDLPYTARTPIGQDPAADALLNKINYVQSKGYADLYDYDKDPMGREWDENRYEREYQKEEWAKNLAMSKNLASGRAGHVAIAPWLLGAAKAPQIINAGWRGLGSAWRGLGKLMATPIPGLQGSTLLGAQPTIGTGLDLTFAAHSLDMLPEVTEALRNAQTLEEENKAWKDLGWTSLGFLGIPGFLKSRRLLKEHPHLKYKTDKYWARNAHKADHDIRPKDFGNNMYRSTEEGAMIPEVPSLLPAVSDPLKALPKGPLALPLGKTKPNVDIDVALPPDEGLAPTGMTDNIYNEQFDRNIANARFGDKKAQESLNEYGIPYKKEEVVTFLKDSEVDQLLSHQQVGWSVARVKSKYPFPVTGEKYRVNFKENRGFDDKLSTSRVNLYGSGDKGFIKDGYGLNDISSIEKLHPDGTWQTVYNEAEGIVKLRSYRRTEKIYQDAVLSNAMLRELGGIDPHMLPSITELMREEGITLKVFEDFLKSEGQDIFAAQLKASGMKGPKFKKEDFQEFAPGTAAEEIGYNIKSADDKQQVTNFFDVNYGKGTKDFNKDDLINFMKKYPYLNSFATTLGLTDALTDEDSGIGEADFGWIVATAIAGIMLGRSQKVKNFKIGEFFKKSKAKVKGWNKSRKKKSLKTKNEKEKLKKKEEKEHGAPLKRHEKFKNKLAANQEGRPLDAAQAEMYRKMNLGAPGETIPKELAPKLIRNPLSAKTRLETTGRKLDKNKLHEQENLLGLETTEINTISSIGDTKAVQVKLGNEKPILFYRTDQGKWKASPGVHKGKVIKVNANKSETFKKIGKELDEVLMDDLNFRDPSLNLKPGDKSSMDKLKDLLPSVVGAGLTAAGAASEDEDITAAGFLGLFTRGKGLSLGKGLKNIGKVVFPGISGFNRKITNILDSGKFSSKKELLNSIETLRSEIESTKLTTKLQLKNVKKFVENTLPKMTGLTSEPGFNLLDNPNPLDPDWEKKVIKHFLGEAELYEGKVKHKIWKHKLATGKKPDKGNISTYRDSASMEQAVQDLKKLQNKLDQTSAYLQGMIKGNKIKNLDDFLVSDMGSGSNQILTKTKEALTQIQKELDENIPFALMQIDKTASLVQEWERTNKSSLTPKYVTSPSKSKIPTKEDITQAALRTKELILLKQGLTEAGINSPFDLFEKITQLPPLQPNEMRFSKSVDDAESGIQSYEVYSANIVELFKNNPKLESLIKYMLEGKWIRPDLKTFPDNLEDDLTMSLTDKIYDRAIDITEAKASNKMLSYVDESESGENIKIMFRILDEISLMNPADITKSFHDVLIETMLNDKIPKDLKTYQGSLQRERVYSLIEGRKDLSLDLIPHASNQMNRILDQFSKGKTQDEILMSDYQNRVHDLIGSTTSSSHPLTGGSKTIPDLKTGKVIDIEVPMIKRSQRKLMADEPSHSVKSVSEPSLSKMKINPEAVKSIESNNAIIESETGGKVFGSSVLASKLEVPTIPKDVDMIMTESDYNANIVNNPNYILKREADPGHANKYNRVGVNKPEDPSRRRDVELDINIIHENPTTGNVVPVYADYGWNNSRSLELELFRQFFPEKFAKYQESMMAKRLKSGNFELIDDIPLTAKELLDAVDPEIKTIIDSYSIYGKGGKDLRPDVLLLLGNTDKVAKGQEAFIKSIVGPKGKLGPQFKPSQFKDPKKNKEILESLGYSKEYLEEAITASPERMQIILNDHWIGNSILTRKVDTGGLALTTGKTETTVQDILDALTKWIPGNAGSFQGEGLNHALMGKVSGYGDIRSYKQYDFNLDTKDPSSYVKSFNSKLDSERLLTKDELDNLEKLFSENIIVDELATRLKVKGSTPGGALDLAGRNQVIEDIFHGKKEELKLKLKDILFSTQVIPNEQRQQIYDGILKALDTPFIVGDKGGLTSKFAGASSEFDPINQAILYGLEKDLEYVGSLANRQEKFTEGDMKILPSYEKFKKIQSVLNGGIERHTERAERLLKNIKDLENQIHKSNPSLKIKGKRIDEMQSALDNASPKIKKLMEDATALATRLDYLSENLRELDNIRGNVEHTQTMLYKYITLLASGYGLGFAIYKTAQNAPERNRKRKLRRERWEKEKEKLKKKAERKLKKPKELTRKQEGGFVEAELTPDEIKDYQKRGYKIEFI